MAKKLFEISVVLHVRLQRCQCWRYFSVPCLERKLNTTLGLWLLVAPQCMLISKDCEKSSTAAEGTIHSNFLMCSRYYQLCLQIFGAVVAVWRLHVPVYHSKALAHRVLAKLLPLPYPKNPKQPKTPYWWYFNMSRVSLLYLRSCQSEEIARSRSVVCEDAPLCFHMQIFNKTSMHLCFLSFLSLGSFMSLSSFYQFSALWFWCLFFINLPAWNLPRTAPTPSWQD